MARSRNSPPPPPSPLRAWVIANILPHPPCHHRRHQSHCGRRRPRGALRLLQRQATPPPSQLGRPHCFATRRCGAAAMAVARRSWVPGRPPRPRSVRGRPLSSPHLWSPGARRRQSEQMLLFHRGGRGADCFNPFLLPLVPHRAPPHVAGPRCVGSMCPPPRGSPPHPVQFPGTEITTSIWEAVATRKPRGSESGLAFHALP